MSAQEPQASNSTQHYARKETSLVLAHDGDECSREDEVYNQYDVKDRRAQPLEVGW